MLKNTCLEHKINLNEKTIIGLNSGTSANGIDAAIIRVKNNGPDSQVSFLSGRTFKFDRALQSKIIRLADPGFKDGEKWLELNIELAEMFAAAALKVMKLAGLRPENVDLIGSHGQTIRHLPNTKRGAVTYQIGDPARIAVRTGIITVGDFRVADAAAGGQGAPLTPVANAILFRERSRDILGLNIGGIANITHIASKAKGSGLFGCDTGPGNMLIDYLARRLFNIEYDRAGRRALRGRADYAIINRILARKFFDIKGAKSTGRESFGRQFGQQFLASCKKRNLSKTDIMATASALTVAAIDRCIKVNKLKFDKLIIGGGGAKNKYLMRTLRDYYPSVEITTPDEGSIPADYLEAVSFAILANEALCSNSYDLIKVTRSRKAVVLGKICQP